jgi:hypothetical protein
MTPILHAPLADAQTLEKRFFSASTPAISSLGSLHSI